MRNATARQRDASPCNHTAEQRNLRLKMPRPLREQEITEGIKK